MTQELIIVNNQDQNDQPTVHLNPEVVGLLKTGFALVMFMGMRTLVSRSKIIVDNQAIIHNEILNLRKDHVTVREVVRLATPAVMQSPN